VLEFFTERHANDGNIIELDIEIIKSFLKKILNHIGYFISFMEKFAGIELGDNGFEYFINN
jgi:hypothetical protein